MPVKVPDINYYGLVTYDSLNLSSVSKRLRLSPPERYNGVQRAQQQRQQQVAQQYQEAPKQPQQQYYQPYEQPKTASDIPTQNHYQSCRQQKTGPSKPGAQYPQNHCQPRTAEQVQPKPPLIYQPIYSDHHSANDDDDDICIIYVSPGIEPDVEPDIESSSESAPPVITSPYFQTAKQFSQHHQSELPDEKENSDSQRNDGNQVYLKGHNFPHSNRLKQLFSQYFKFNSFRTNQFEAINAACLGLDTLILMPTGAGKSICYQLPAIVCQGLTIVLSPLRSLIEDQVNKLKGLCIKTSALSGETSPLESDEIYADLRSSHPSHKLLYVTPEKINCSESLMSLLKQLYKRDLLSRFVIDEAHCVSMWGSDFRPDYRKLGLLRTNFPSVPIMALTATAPPKVRVDILNQLHMDFKTAKVFLQSFNRPNLKFEVRKKSKSIKSDIVKLIKKNFNNQSGIIYCLSRDECETVAGNLRDEGISSVPYHAGLNKDRRNRVFQSWEQNKTKVVCATIAFGMGIDKSNVRFVIHFSMPKSIEGYYQEAGRAGRDGQFAHCILYYSQGDIYRMKCLLRGSKQKDKDKNNLEQIAGYCSNTNQCRRTFLLRYLGEQFNRRDCVNRLETACDNCLRKS